MVEISERFGQVAGSLLALEIKGLSSELACQVSNMGRFVVDAEHRLGGDYRASEVRDSALSILIGANGIELLEEAAVLAEGLDLAIEGARALNEPRMVAV